VRQRVHKNLREQLLLGALRLVGGRPENLQSGLMPAGIHHFDFNDARVVASCLPSVNGMFTARALARMYAALAGSGQVDGQRILSPQRMEAIAQVQNRRRDRVVPLPMHWRLGYHRVFTTGPRTPGAFGHFGFGGSGAWCDPHRDLAVGLTVNSGLGTPFGDSRLAFINTAAIQCAEKTAASKNVPATVWH
jgi:CubicO group peptidase (beta-lactamase class C family)